MLKPHTETNQSNTVHSKIPKEGERNIANIVYDLSQFHIQNIFILDNKKNIIMDGKFTKIVYSDHFFISHGIFLMVDLLLDGIIDYNVRADHSEKQHTRILTRDKEARDIDTRNVSYNGGSKFFVKLQPKLAFNERIVNRLIGIETSILEFYKNIYHCTKRSMTILKNQLLNGLIKIHYKIMSDKIRGTNFAVPKRFVLKISGIWEDSENIGLTYRFMCD
jgi:hypothetical protein